MLITRKSIMSGIERTFDLPVTQEQLDAWKSGVLIQKAMPNLTPSQREFIMTGMIDEEFDTLDEDSWDDGDSWGGGPW